MERFFVLCEIQDENGKFETKAQSIFNIEQYADIPELSLDYIQLPPTFQKGFDSKLVLSHL